MKRFAAIDFETANGHLSSVCSVGVVVMEDANMVDSYYSLICPEPRYYSYFNTKVHGLAAEDTEDAPTFPTVWRDIRAMIKDMPLVAHNSSFDEGCLKAAHACHEMPYAGYDFYCTYRLSRRMLKGVLPNHKLNTVAAYCGFALENHHHALADAEACAAIMNHLLSLEEVF